MISSTYREGKQKEVIKAKMKGRGSNRLKNTAFSNLNLYRLRGADILREGESSWK